MGTIAAMVTQALLLALGVMLALAFLLALAILVRPGLLERFERTSNRRYSMDHVTSALDTPRNIDRYFYRHHRLYGATVVILAVALLSFLAFRAPEVAWQSLFDGRMQEVGAILTDTGRVVLWILGLFALAIGAVVFLRPSALKSLEARANRWLRPQEAIRGLDREFHGPEQWVRRHPRAWGLVIALLSALCLLALILQTPAILRLVG